jgi:hypothetical protein
MVQKKVGEWDLSRNWKANYPESDLRAFNLEGFEVYLNWISGAPHSFRFDPRDQFQIVLDFQGVWADGELY